MLDWGHAGQRKVLPQEDGGDERGQEDEGESDAVGPL